MDGVKESMKDRVEAEAPGRALVEDSMVVEHCDSVGRQREDGSPADFLDRPADILHLQQTVLMNTQLEIPEPEVVAEVPGCNSVLEGCTAVAVRAAEVGNSAVARTAEEQEADTLLLGSFHEDPDSCCAARHVRTHSSRMDSVHGMSAEQVEVVEIVSCFRRRCIVLLHLPFPETVRCVREMFQRDQVVETTYLIVGCPSSCMSLLIMGLTVSLLWWRRTGWQWRGRAGSRHAWSIRLGREDHAAGTSRSPRGSEGKKHAECALCSIQRNFGSAPTEANLSTGNIPTPTSGYSRYSLINLLSPQCGPPGWHRRP